MPRHGIHVDGIQAEDLRHVLIGGEYRRHGHGLFLCGVLFYHLGVVPIIGLSQAPIVHGFEKLFSQKTVMVTEYRSRLMTVGKYRLIALNLNAPVPGSAAAGGLGDRFLPGGKQKITPCKRPLDSARRGAAVPSAAFGEEHDELIVVVEFVLDDLKLVAEEGNIMEKTHLSFKPHLGGIETLQQCSLRRIAPYRSRHHQRHGFPHAGAAPEMNHKGIDAKRLHQRRSAGRREDQTAYPGKNAAVVGVCFPYLCITVLPYGFKGAAVIIVAVVDVFPAIGHKVVIHPAQPGNGADQGNTVHAQNIADVTDQVLRRGTVDNDTTGGQ